MWRRGWSSSRSRVAILVSGTAYDQLRDKLGLPLDFVGDQRVKNIPQPVRTYSVRMEGTKRALAAHGFERSPLCCPDRSA